jgi:hypothetical protein
MRAIGLLAALLAATLPIASAAQATPNSDAPIAVTDPFVIPWHHESVLACITFTNTTDRVIDAVRFGLTTEQENPLGSEPATAVVDRVGSFAPGAAIRPSAPEPIASLTY